MPPWDEAASFREEQEENAVDEGQRLLEHGREVSGRRSCVTCGSGSGEKAREKIRECRAHAVLQGGADPGLVPLGTLDDFVEQRRLKPRAGSDLSWGAPLTETICPQEAPQDRECLVILERGVEIELQESSSVRAPGVHDAQLSAVEAQAPSRVDPHAVPDGLAPDATEVFRPSGHEQGLAGGRRGSRAWPEGG